MLSRGCKSFKEFFHNVSKKMHSFLITNFTCSQSICNASLILYFLKQIHCPADFWVYSLSAEIGFKPVKKSLVCKAFSQSSSSRIGLGARRWAGKDDLDFVDGLRR
jgi:hypothetical protein